MGTVSCSLARVSDGLDSARDSITSTITLRQRPLRPEPTDQAHPYGHGRAETLAAGIQAVMIAGGGCYVIYRAVDRLIRPAWQIHAGLDENADKA